MEKISFYTVSKEYLDYLRQFENKISNHNNVDGGTYVGIVLKQGEYNYFVPLTSYNPTKENKMKKRSRIIIRLFEKDNQSNKLGYMLFNNMIPVPLSELVRIDLSDKTIAKNKMMDKQYIFMNSILERIKNKAHTVYRNRVNGDNYFVNWCCDFELLERKSSEFVYKKYK